MVASVSGDARVKGGTGVGALYKSQARLERPAQSASAHSALNMKLVRAALHQKTLFLSQTRQNAFA